MVAYRGMGGSRTAIQSGVPVTGTLSGATKVEHPQSERASRKTRPEKVPGQVRHAGHPGPGSDAVHSPTRAPQNVHLFHRRAAS